MSAQEDVALAIDRLVSGVDIEARDNGHLPAWEYPQGESGDVAYGTCQHCGQTAAVRYPTFRAGKLRHVPCPSAPE